MVEITKRDGRKVPFDREKITQAIGKAFHASNEDQPHELYEVLTDDIVTELEGEGVLSPSIEKIQDTVEEILIKHNFARVAKAYILYRAERTKVRETNSRLIQTYDDITFKDAKDSDSKRENANIDGDSAMGTMLKYGSEGAKHFYGIRVLKPEHAEAHSGGDIHIHDLDFLTMTTTCCQIDIINLFKGGFSTGHGVIREPQDVRSYSALACIAIQSNQNDQHGGQSIANFDYGLAIGVKKTFIKQYRRHLGLAIELNMGVKTTNIFKEIQIQLLDDGEKLAMDDFEPYCDRERALILDAICSRVALLQSQMSLITEDNMKRCQQFAIGKAIEETNEATFQAMEALVHNLNTMHSRAGAQVPFSSINYGMDTSCEGRMVIRNILLALDAGMGNNETPIFPIHIFRVKEGVNFNEGDTNYDLFKLACKVSAKRLYPNFSFQDAPYNLKYYKGTPETEISYMGCRTRVISNVYDTDQEISYGRGNLNYTTINLPRIGLSASGDLDKFFSRLDEMLNLCIEQLIERFNILANKRRKNFPFLMGEGIWLDSDKLEREDKLTDVLKHGTLSIGFIGLAECLTALTGYHHGESDDAQKLGLRIIQHMYDRLTDESQRQKMNFTLLATPAEGLSGRFVKIDKKIFGSIEGVTDRDYYTNSFHVPVHFKIGAFNKINIEAPYHAMTNAGHITFVELDGDVSQNLQAFESIIRCMHSAGIGYGSINHPVDQDNECGYVGIIGNQCPKCGREETVNRPFTRIRRITGYLGSLDRFNDAKKVEESERTKHSLTKGTSVLKYKHPHVSNLIIDGSAED